jgi:hypothetical protein
MMVMHKWIKLIELSSKGIICPKNTIVVEYYLNGGIAMMLLMRKRNQTLIMGIEFQQNDLVFRYYMSVDIALSPKHCNP